MWNGRVSDKIEIERRTAEYNALVERHDSVVEKSLVPHSSPASATGRRAIEKPRIEIQPTEPTEGESEQPLPTRMHEAREETETVKNSGRLAAADPNPTSGARYGSDRAGNNSGILAAIIEKPPAQPAVSRKAPAVNTPVSTSPVQSEAKPDGTVVDAAEAERMSQEIIRLRNQVDAFRNTERNLKERLNRQEQYIESVKGMQAAGDQA